AEQEETIDILANRIKSSKATGWRQLGALGKLHNLVSIFEHPNADTTGSNGVAGQALGLDDDTRWNSWYPMLVTALK
ncbi:hypothetical protein V1505DRAFT_358159, partial [Lipomyces doorenjongii]